ncbi:MAG: PAS domain-containing sensor histidine kinase [Burkholderiales bacterium]
MTGRARAPSAAGDDASWFRLIAESADDFIAVLDRDGKRLYANPALARVLGPARSRPGSLSFGDVHPEDRKAIERLFEQTVADGKARRGEFRFELTDGTVRYVESQGNTICDASGCVSKVVVVSRDVTDRRHTEDRLRRREMQLQAAQELAILGSWEIDIPSGDIRWSPELRRIFGVDDGFQPGVESSMALVHPEDREEFARATAVALEQGLVYDKPYRIVRPDGGVRTLFASGRAEVDDAGALVRLVGVCQDITDRKWIEERARTTAERLRAVSHRLVEVQESERRLLARELHDRVGQSLTALGLNLKVVAADVPAEVKPELSARLEECMDLVEETVAAMRGVMGELRPQAIDEYGLVAALRAFARPFAARTGIHVSVAGEDRPDHVPKTVELAMFRIAQEALNNVAKHSRATAVEVSCRGVGARTVLSLQDDGIGFDAEQAAGAGAKARWGLVIMRERAEAVGAKFSIVSAPQRGARVVVDYPG